MQNFLSGPAQGFVAPGFEPVGAAFAANFTGLGDRGAAFAATWRGVPVVDLWGGAAAPDRPWRQDTLQVIFSGTKALLAACMALLIERGQLDPERPVRAYWPEFAANGKAHVRVRHLLTHRSGLPGLSVPIGHDDILDDVAMEAAIAAAPLLPDPDAFLCYHPLSVGWMCGALLRRIDGRSTGRFFRDEFAGPLGLDTWIGLPETEEHRVSVLERSAKHGPWIEAVAPPAEGSPLLHAVAGNPVLFPAAMPWNRQVNHAAEIPAAGGISDARSLARLAGMLSLGGSIDGLTLLQPATVDRMTAEQCRFADPVSGASMVFGMLFALQTADGRFGPPPRAFGHTGAGGAILGAWPDQEVGFAYVQNQLRAGAVQPRRQRLLDSLYACIGSARG